MVKLIVTARIVPELSYLGYVDQAEDFSSTLPRTKKLKGEKTLVTNVDKPGKWKIGDLACEFARLYREVYKCDFGSIKYIKYEWKDADISAFKTCEELLVDAGAASESPKDQQPTIIIIQEGGFCQRQGSVVPNLSRSEFAARTNERTPAPRGKAPQVPRFPEAESSTGKHQRESEELDDHTGSRKRSRTHQGSSSLTFDHQGHALSIEHDVEDDGMQLFEDAPESSGLAVQDAQGSLRTQIPTARDEAESSNADTDAEPQYESPEAPNTIWNQEPSGDLEESAARSLTPEVPERHSAQIQQRSVSRQSSSNLEHLGAFQEAQGSVLSDNPTAETTKRKKVVLNHVPKKPMTPPSNVSNHDRDAMPASVLLHPAPRTKSSSVSDNGAPNRFKQVHKNIYEPVDFDIEDSQMSPKFTGKGKARRSASGEASRKKSIKGPITKRTSDVGDLPFKDLTTLMDSGGQIVNGTRHWGEPNYYSVNQATVMSDQNDLTYQDTEDERTSETGQRLSRYSHEVDPKTSDRVTDLRNAQVSHQLDASDDSTTQMCSRTQTPLKQLEPRAEPGDMELPDAEPTLPDPPINRIKKKVAEQFVSVDIPATAEQKALARHHGQQATHVMHQQLAVTDQAQTPSSRRKRKSRLNEDEHAKATSHQRSSTSPVPQLDTTQLAMSQDKSVMVSKATPSTKSSPGAQLDNDLKASTQDAATAHSQSHARSEDHEKIAPLVRAVLGEIYTGVIDHIHAWGITVALTGLVGKPVGLVPAKAVQEDGKWAESSNRLEVGKPVIVKVLRLQNEKIGLTMQGIAQTVGTDSEDTVLQQNQRPATPIQEDGKASKAKGRRKWTPQAEKVLIQARLEGLRFRDIQKTHFPNRTLSSCQQRYRVLQSKSRKSTGPNPSTLSESSSKMPPTQDSTENDGGSDDGSDDGIEIRRDIVKLPGVDEEEPRLGLGITDTPSKLRKSSSSAVEPVSLNLSTAAPGALREKLPSTSTSNAQVKESAIQSLMPYERSDKAHSGLETKHQSDAMEVNTTSSGSLQPNGQQSFPRAIAPSRKNRERNGDHGEVGPNPILPPGLTLEEYQKRRSEKERGLAQNQAPDTIQYTRNDPSEKKPSTFTAKKPKTQSGRDANGVSTPPNGVSVKSASIGEKPNDKRPAGLRTKIGGHAATPAPQISLSRSTDRIAEQPASSSCNEKASMPKPHQKSLPTPKPSPILPNSTVIRKQPTGPRPVPTKKPAPSTTLPLARAAPGKLNRPSKPKPAKPMSLVELHNARTAEVAAAKARSSALPPYSYTPNGSSAKSTALPSLGSDDDDESSSSSGSDASSESEDGVKGKASKMSEKTKSKPALRDRDMSVEVDTDIDTDDEGSIAA